jgi:hypothetical protein
MLQNVIAVNNIVNDKYTLLSTALSVIYENMNNVIHLLIMIFEDNNYSK